MSANCSGNDSLHCESSSFDSYDSSQCIDPISNYIAITHVYTNMAILFPVSVLVLSLGVRRWRRQRCASSAAALSASDFITYNLAVMELIGVLGNAIFLCGYSFKPDGTIMWAGLLIGFFPWYGQMFFPVLSCVERYLAVVHPITYMTLRQGRGIRIRNNTTACIWFQCLAGMAMMCGTMDHIEINLIMSACEMAVLLIAMSFCSLSILCVLNRPRPGEAGGDRIDQSKRRALNTIVIVMAVLSLRFGGNLICYVMSLSSTLSHGTKCVVRMLAGWFNLPSSLSLPLLFLHRVLKLPGCKPKTESG